MSALPKPTPPRDSHVIGAIGAPPAGATQNPAGRDAIGAWLETLGALLHLPDVERAAVRDELASHLRERVRDLMVAGETETDATRRALGELGDAAKLARRFHDAANRPFRRRLMSFATLGMAGAALVTGVVAISMNQEGGERLAKDWVVVRGEAYSPVLPEYPDKGAPQVTLDDLQFTDTPIAEVFEQLAKSAKARAVVKWAALEPHGIATDSLVTLEAGKVDLAGAFAAINDSLGNVSGTGPGTIDFRMRDGVLEVATVEYFDKRETTLVTYNVEAVLATLEEEKLTSAIYEFIEPEAWRENGGETAALKVLGSKMLVKAPPRMCRQIEWLLAQLGGDQEPKLGAIRPDQDMLVEFDLGVADRRYVDLVMPELHFQREAVELSPEVQADIRRQLNQQIEPAPADPSKPKPE